MKFFKQYYKGIIAGASFAVGLIPLIAGKTQFTQLGIFCLIWAVAVLFIGSIAREKCYEGVREFDKQTKKIIKDLRIRGEESEYYGLTNLTIIGKERKKFVKKLQSTYKTCYIISIFLIIGCILCAI